MAWNEPGGGKDPWGNRGDQGPPDLDEAFRKLQAQLSGIFGGGRGNSGSTSGGGFNGKIFGILLGLGAIGYFALGLYQVDQGEQGVVFRFGAVQEQVVGPGLHWNPPIIDRVELVNVTRVNSHSHQALMLTEDENIVDVSVTVQYVVSDPKGFLVNVRDPRVSVTQATESALRHVVGGSGMNDVITEGREAIGIGVQERLQAYLDSYGTGIRLDKVNIDRSAPPSQVADAFNDVQKAKEDEQRLINEANAHAETVIPESRGEAQRILEEANAYRDRVVARAEGEADRFNKLLAEYKQAEGVTRDRLYIDAMESILGNTSKVMIAMKDGNNIMYLPLDRITPSAGGAAPPAGEDAIRGIADSVVRQLDARGSGDSARTNR
ncbi:MAG TPA: FtsH protease activity modulator HflK [Gammaproteobacteria bacterium]|jgi:membrane protease subunit HflK|nr:FtsH protease activity modulator HflK [Gammaproteobacteria bacterium]